MKTLALVLASGLAGALVVVACSDDSPSDADAAVCDCPAAEPPITAARLHRVENARIADTNAVSSAAVDCPVGELLLSGSCYLDVDNTAREVTITYSGQIPSDPTMTGRTWRCDFTNKSPTATPTFASRHSACGHPSDPRALRSGPTNERCG